MNLDESILSKLTDAQKKAVEAAQSPEELISLAKEHGFELSPDQLESLSGGANWSCNSRYGCSELCWFCL